MDKATMMICNIPCRLGHDDIVAAKTDEINTLKKQLITKKQRLAEGRVQVTQKEEQATKTKARIFSFCSLAK